MAILSINIPRETVLLTTSEMNSSKREKSEIGLPCFMASMNDDLLNNILGRLPAKSFAFASCVCRSWNNVSCRILSRPMIRSAFAVGRDVPKAAEEVLDKVLSKPMRPDFAIANVTSISMLEEIQTMIVKRVGSRIPIIVSLVAGILGKEACSDEFRKLNWDNPTDDDTTDVEDSAILLTIGYTPGLKVEVIPIIKRDEESFETMGDEFVMDIRKYVSSVSDHTAPIGVILFGGKFQDVEPIIEKLDYAMPGETLFMGDERSQFVYRRANEPISARLNNPISGSARILAGLVFATDRHKPPNVGEIRFHAMISRGISPVGPRYKAASVRVNNLGFFAFLTAKREGQPEILDGQQLLDDINNLLGNRAEDAILYIGVTKRRNCSVGSKKPKPITSLVYHEVTGGDEHCLTVQGARIRTGDYFQFYYSDPEAARASVNDVSSQLRHLKTELNNSTDRVKTEFVGGFIFTCCGRGEPFFGSPDIDGSPFLENLPESSFGGILCGGEIFRSSREENGRRERSVRQCLHVYSAAYLLVSYTHPSSSSS
ncbi:PREDICTED: F-box/LRR-repeat protein At5g63520 [Tarenaya hassleriana]|uniref:F-box/LRR-repeat protein At5g63520 n=1 Tax=Tarenaya hassleriana TaxID=28532 RepID=UPI00053C8C62|nr:PREDICTED: F-box/LRR-repeat protein At5g63520 [Tarenaya hassleriana]